MRRFSASADTAFTKRVPPDLILRSRSSTRWLLAALISLVLPSEGLCLDAIEVAPDTSGLAPYEYMQVFRDPSGRLTHEHVMAQPETRWQPSANRIFSVGFTRSTYWFRFDLLNPTARRQGVWLVVGNPRLEKVNLYTLVDGQVTQYLKSGSAIEPTAKPVRHRYQILPINVPQAARATIYLEVQTADAFQVPLALWSPERFTEGDQLDILLQGAYSGIWVLLLLLSLALALRSDASQIKGFPAYISFAFCFGLLQFSITGVGGGIFWAGLSELFALSNPLTIGLALMSACWCIGSLLPVDGTGRVLRPVYWVLGLLGGVTLAAIPILNFQVLSWAQHLLVLPVALLSIGVALIFARRRQRGLPLLTTLSWIFLMLMILVLATSRLGWIPATPLWIPLTSTAFLTMLLCTTLSSWSLLMHQRALSVQEVLEFEREARRQQTALNQRLEQEFRSTTQDLSRALNQLSETNKSLIRHSTADEVTGIHNRHHFDEAFQTEWRRAIRHGYSITLLLVEVDEFPAILDRYGRSVADNCLRDIADTIVRCLRRPADFVARYDEQRFIVVLPYLLQENGGLLAERVRSEVEALMMISENYMIQATVSIGVATLAPSNRISKEDLLATAETALREARLDGVNQVYLAE